MRKVILSMEMSLDGFVAGPNDAMDWFDPNDKEHWTVLFDLLPNIDAMLLGGNMYPGYAEYWKDAVNNPSKHTVEEVKFAKIADKTPHIVFSKTKKAEWDNTRIVTDPLDETIKKMKKEPGKDMIVWGGASLASSLIKLDLVDEYHLITNPVILGAGKNLFTDVQKHQLELISSNQFKGGAVQLKYRRKRD
jgi:dihydrofolate reductase